MEQARVTADPISVLLVSDHAALGHTVERFLGDEESIDAAGTVCFADASVEHILARGADIVLVDLSPPVGRGLDGIARLRARCPQMGLWRYRCSTRLPTAPKP
jgi:DNA-binding NarL/FixJ family response regulator